MPKAGLQPTSTMSGAPAPRALSQWIEHLKRRRLAGKKARQVQRQRRHFSEARLERAEAIIKEITESGDILGQGKMVTEDWPVPVTFVLLALEPWAFKSLCDYGGDLQDDEDTNDAEPGHDAEHTLGWPEGIRQATLCGGSDDGEPSLGSTGMVDQRRWHEGDALPYGNDLELDHADDEPSIGVDTPDFDICDLGEHAEYPRAQDQAIIEEVRSHYAAATGGEVSASPALDPDGKPGAWLLQRRQGGES